MNWDPVFVDGAIVPLLLAAFVAGAAGIYILMARRRAWGIGFALVSLLWAAWQFWPLMAVALGLSALGLVVGHLVWVYYQKK